MPGKVTTASVAASDRTTANNLLKKEINRGNFPKDAEVLSVSDEGEHLRAYTQYGSFSVSKEKSATGSVADKKEKATNASSRKTR